MTDSILSNKRRLERHSRRDGNLQARARPLMAERKEDHEDASSAGYIRSFVENAHQGVNFMNRRLVFGGPSGGNNGGNNGGDDGGDGAGSTTRGGGNSSGGGSTTDGGNTGGGRPGGFSDYTSDTTTHRSTVDTSRNTAALTSTTDTRTSTTPTSTRTSTTPTSTRTTSSSSAILTTTASATTPTTTALPTTSVAFVTASPTQSVDLAAASSTSKDSSGPGAGPIIGIVAGSLAGIAVIAVIIGFLFKKFGRKEDPYEADPFDRDSFRRQSAMLPETFESDDGHPSMAEHSNLHNSMGPFSDAGYAGAGVAGVGGLAAASSYASHNESGGPRPPTMFQKHINGPGAQYSMSDAPVAPQIGAIYNPNDLTPQLPPMAFGGSDPYSIAGVGRNHHMDGNMSNPYAHLDRSMSSSMQQQQLQQQQAQPRQERYEGQGMYADLNRNGSDGSYSNEQYRSVNEAESASHGYTTSGRPGTAEGRSGTPDLPNVQQTYALGDESQDDHKEFERVASPHRTVASPQHMSQDMYAQYQQSPFHDGGSPPQQPLQVRNLLPNPHEAQHRQQGQRPISTASSQPGDEDAAYGGVW